MTAADFFTDGVNLATQVPDFLLVILAIILSLWVYFFETQLFKIKTTKELVSTEAALIVAIDIGLIITEIFRRYKAINEDSPLGPWLELFVSLAGSLLVVAGFMLSVWVVKILVYILALALVAKIVLGFGWMSVLYTILLAVVGYILFRYLLSFAIASYVVAMSIVCAMNFVYGGFYFTVHPFSLDVASDDFVGITQRHSLFSWFALRATISSILVTIRLVMMYWRKRKRDQQIERKKAAIEHAAKQLEAGSHGATIQLTTPATTAKKSPNSKQRPTEEKEDEDDDRAPLHPKANQQEEEDSDTEQEEEGSKQSNVYVRRSGIARKLKRGCCRSSL